MFYTAPIMTQAATHPHHARGVLAEATPDTVTFAVPGTDYQILLGVLTRVTSPTGKRLVGTIRVSARRIDLVHTGGRYIEPVYGRPRRIQGNVIAVDLASKSLIIDACVPMVVKPTDPRQKAEDFNPGDLVAFDVVPTAMFTPA